jgi:mannose-6-phosphate isomerase-like protein (cupin superfamily)
VTIPRHRREGEEPFRWEGVDVREYKPDDGGEPTFKDLSRQILFDDSNLDHQVRFFDIEPGGHTTLERHKHTHSVVVLGGHGQCLVGDFVFDLMPHDLIAVEQWEWHQFRAAPDDHLGFICIVNCNRDRPQLPNAPDLERLTRYPEIATFLGLTHPGD